jgi:hypothetical protein
MSADIAGVYYFTFAALATSITYSIIKHIVRRIAEETIGHSDIARYKKDRYQISIIVRKR